jgi:hypothetical protein
MSRAWRVTLKTRLEKLTFGRWSTPHLRSNWRQIKAKWRYSLQYGTFQRRLPELRARLGGGACEAVAQMEMVGIVGQTPLIIFKMRSSYSPPVHRDAATVLAPLIAGKITMREEGSEMIRLIAIAGFALLLATSAQAMTAAPLHQPSMITNVAFGCGLGRTRVGGICVARTTIRHARR